MPLIFDRGEFRLIGDHILSLFAPSRTPELPDTYGGIQPGDLAGWDHGSVELLLEEARRRLDSTNAHFEAIRNRSQYLLGACLAALGLLGGFANQTIDRVWVFSIWALGMGFLLTSLLISFASFASTVRLGSVDPVLFSREDGQHLDETARSLARGYTKAVRLSTTAVHVRFTLYRDAVWFFVFGVMLGTLSVVVGRPGT